MHRQNRSLRSASLRFLLPTWLHEGGISATLERLADPYVRSRIRQKIAEVGFNNFGQIDSWADIRHRHLAAWRRRARPNHRGDRARGLGSYGKS